MANKMLKWVTGSSAAYAALQTKDVNTLYFIQDTGEIFRGTKSFSEAVIFVSEFPAKGAVGKVYIKETNLEGKVWNGTAWKTIIQPIATTLSDDVVETKAVSGEAVKAYVVGKFAEELTDRFVDGISYDKDTKELLVTKGGEESTIALDGFVTNVSHASGVLTFNVEGGDDIVINLPEDNFVQSGVYDEATKEIILTLQDGSKVKIPAADLVDVYVGGETESASVTVSASNEITVDVKVSAAEGNALSVTEDGLFVEHTDITGKMDKVASAKAGEILVAKADGQAEVSGIKAGAATLGATPNATTLATEAAVNAIRTALQTNIDAKFDKSFIKTSLVTRDASEASDEHVLSEKATLMKLEALDAKKVDVAKVVTAINADAPAADKIVSEQALVAAMSWTVLTDPQA